MRNFINELLNIIESNKLNVNSEELSNQLKLVISEYNKSIEYLKFYESIIHSQTEMICRYLPDLTLTFVNDAYCHARCQKREQLLGKKITDFIDEDCREKFIDYVEHFGKFRISNSIEQKITLDNGVTKWELWGDNAVFDEYGRIVEFQAVGRDITDQKNTEIELEKSRARLNSIFNNNFLSIILINKELKICEFNRIAEERIKRLYGLSIKMESNFYDYVPAELANFYDEVLKNVFKGDNVIFEMHIKDTAGNKTYWFTNNIPIHNADGTIFGACLTSIETTKFKEFESQYKLFEENVKQMLSNSNQAFVVVGLDNKIKVFNELANDISLKVIGRPLQTETLLIEIIPEKKIKIITEMLLNVKDGKFKSAEAEFKDLSGQKYWWNFNFSPIFDSEGKINSIFISIIDITEKKMLEQELVKLNSELELRVTERTAELENANKKLRAEIMLREKAEKEVVAVKNELIKKYSFYDLVGKSPQMQGIMDMLNVISENDCNVLIEGPSGTGKSLIAKIIHNLYDPDNKKPFIVLNCGAFPETLLESELFGYVKGAFTGANRDKAGKFEAADGGTIFLDEIAEMPIQLQVKLLRVIEDKCFEPLGSNVTCRVNAKIIAATNKDIPELIKQNKFRLDLYYRLKVANIKIPSLSERREDIDLLIDYFIVKFNDKYKKNIKGLSKEVYEFFMIYDFPGNIRELENIFNASFIFCNGDYINSRHIPAEYRQIIDEKMLEDKNYHAAGIETISVDEAPFNYENITAIDLSEKQCILETLKHFNFNRTLAAQRLKIDRTTLWRKMKKYNLL